VSTDTQEIAQAATALDPDLADQTSMLDQMDTGMTSAKRGLARSSVPEIEAQIRRERVAAVMWAIEGDLKYRTGNAYDHKRVANHIVDALFPEPAPPREV
jgi:hypothetical protein